MQISIPSIGGLSLAISDEPDEISEYPTRRLMKGIVMSLDGLSLTEEAVGFGLPVIKRGLQTYFPGTMTLQQMDSSGHSFTARYVVNLVERMQQRGRLLEDQAMLYSAKNLLAALIRNNPKLRKPLTLLSSRMRTRHHWQTVYTPAAFEDQVDVNYLYQPMEHTLECEVDLSRSQMTDVSEVVIMNEQGGAAFDLYRDSRGQCLNGDQIGAWDEVSTGKAGFYSSALGIGFSLEQIAGARLFRGREKIDQRLSWSGFGYSISPGTNPFRYTIELEKPT